MVARTIAIGDIHGCADALAALLAAIEPSSENVIITLGDHIDRGLNTRSVLDQLLILSGRCHLIPLLGNHEEALLDALGDRNALRRWLSLGGTDTLRSYGWTPGSSRRALADWFPQSHQDFLARCQSYYETPGQVFTHAGLVADLPIAEQPALALRWRVTNAATAQPHESGKVVIVGHTPQPSGEILDLGFLVCIDTNCVRGGWLTALDTTTGQLWQVSKSGRLRIGADPPGSCSTLG